MPLRYSLITALELTVVTTETGSNRQCQRSRGIDLFLFLPASLVSLFLSFFLLLIPSFTCVHKLLKPFPSH